MNLEKLGPKLRSVRNSLDLTLEEVSSRLDVAPSYLSEIERGNKVPSLKMLCSLSSYLDLSRSFLRNVLAGPEGEGKTLEEMLVSRRKELGFTKNELSREIGWPRSHIEAIESGDSSLPGGFLGDLSRALSLPEDFFKSSGEKSIGTKVKFFRQRNDFTQLELAERSGLSTSLVSKIERGQVQPSLPTLAKISEALGISPCCFVFRVKQKQSDRGLAERDEKQGNGSVKESVLQDIISTLSELDEEELEELREYISRLRR